MDSKSDWYLAGIVVLINVLSDHSSHDTMENLYNTM